MKKNVFFVILAILTLNSSVILEEHTKVGLTLSGGGALGLAHIGVIEVLDSLGIKADYVAGTSMGGIIGGLYSIGYTGKELRELALSIDWPKIFEDKIPRNRLPYFLKRNEGRYQLEFGIENFKPVTKGGLITGQNIYMTLARLTFPYEYVENFDELPIPFRCVSVDIISGNEVIHKRGSLAKAIRATMAIPTVFSPVVWGDSILIDGGLVNNFPADVAKEMGSDFVIGVFVYVPMKDSEEIRTTFDILTQSYAISRNYNMRKNSKLADILIEVPLSGYGAFDFEKEKINNIINLGKKTAYANLPALLKLGSSYTVSDSNEFIVDDIEIIGKTIVFFEKVKDLFDISPGDVVTKNEIKLKVSKLKNSGLYRDVSYSIVPLGTGTVKINLFVESIEPPEIVKVDVSGNKNFSASFIQRIVGIEPGMRIKIEVLEDRIKYLYSFDYFENITYELIPLQQDKAILKLNVKEKYINRVRFGFRYDNRYNLIALLGYENLSLLIPGLRIDGELIGLGFSQFRLNISYPSRTMNTPIYPYISIWSLNKPYYIYDNKGIKKASFFDKSKGCDLGLGLLMKNKINFTVKAGREFQRFKPDVGADNPVIFSYQKDNINKFGIELEFDNLNDSFYPADGMKTNFELFNFFKSSLIESEYRYLSFDLSLYRTIGRNTFQTKVFAGFGKELPIYKFFYLGGKEDFWGVNYEQLTVNEIVSLTFKYGMNLGRNFRPSVGFSFSPHYRFNYKNLHRTGKNLFGVGIGLSIFTPLGPLEFVISNGEENIYNKGNRVFNYYFSYGIIF